MLAEVEMRGPERRVALEARHTGAVAALRTLRRLANEQDAGVEPEADDASSVAAQLAELLPLSADQKQSWLEIDDPVERLDAIMPAIALLRTRRPKV
jgi:Lon protease-like protein